MNTMKKILFLLTIAVGAKADVADEILKYTNLVKGLCAMPALGEQSKAKCKTLVSIGEDASGISRNVEDFKNKHIETVSRKGDELIALLKCMDKGGMATDRCKALKCTSENDCIALVLKTTKELLDPIVNELIARKEETKNPDGSVVMKKNPDGSVMLQNGKPVPEMLYKNGALFRLASLRFVPQRFSADFQAMRQKVGMFADNIIGALDFLNALAIILSPDVYLATTPQLSIEEKRKIEEVPALELPEGTQIDPDLGLLDEL